MKKIVNTTNILVFFIIALFISIASCKKDTNCTAQIYVKTQADTNITVPGAWVNIQKYVGEVGDSGFTDGNGMYTHVFPLEAIMDVKVTDNTTTTPRHGIGTIRLSAGKTTRLTVFVQ